MHATGKLEKYHSKGLAEKAERNTTVQPIIKRRRGRPRKKVRQNNKYSTQTSKKSSGRMVRRTRKVTGVVNQHAENTHDNAALDAHNNETWKDQELYEKQDMIHKMLPDLNPLLEQMEDATQKRCTSSFRQAEDYRWNDRSVPQHRRPGSSGIEHREAEKLFLDSATEFCRRLQIYREIYRMLSSKKIELALRRKRVWKKKCLVTVRVGKKKGVQLLKKGAESFGGNDKSNNVITSKQIDLKINDGGEDTTEVKNKKDMNDRKTSHAKYVDEDANDNDNDNAENGALNEEEDDVDDSRNNGADSENNDTDEKNDDYYKEEEEEDDDDEEEEEEDDDDDDDDDETVFADEVGPTLGRRAGISRRVRGSRRS